MSNVEFDSDQRGPENLQRFSTQYTSQYNTQQPRHASGMVNFLLKIGIIKTEEQARGVLLLILCMNFIIAGFIVYYFVLN